MDRADVVMGALLWVWCWTRAGPTSRSEAEWRMCGTADAAERHMSAGEGRDGTLYLGLLLPESDLDPDLDPVMRTPGGRPGVHIKAAVAEGAGTPPPDCAGTSQRWRPAPRRAIRPAATADNSEMLSS